MIFLIIKWFSLNKITRLIKWYIVKRVNIIFFLCIWNTLFMKHDIFSDAYWFENIEIHLVFFLWNSQIVFEFFLKDSSFSSLIKTSKYWEMIWMDLIRILQKLYHVFISIFWYFIIPCWYKWGTIPSWWPIISWSSQLKFWKYVCNR